MSNTDYTSRAKQVRRQTFPSRPVVPASTERIRTASAGESAGTFRCAIGGESCRNRKGAAETSGSARWEGGALAVTATLERLIGATITTVDRCQLSPDRRTQTMERTFVSGGQPSPARGRLVFTRR
jgi:hypothetical protein